jgi:hypothetical protein
VVVHVYSPIVHYHEMALKFSLQTDFEYWRGVNFDMLRRADGLYVLGIEGVETSKGVQAEIKFAIQCGLPIHEVSVDGDLYTWQG